MFLLAIYLIGLACFILVFARKNYFTLNEKNLTSQPLFWTSLFIPIISFFYFGAVAWLDRSLEISTAGFDEFITISKLPLGLLSLAIPFVSIVVSAHRATQMAAQINVTEKKNSLDKFYAHEKHFIERCKVFDMGETMLFSKENSQKLQVPLPHQLYRKVYKGTSNRENPNYEVDTLTESFIRVKVENISSNLWKHVELIEKREAISLTDELKVLHVLLLLTYEVFDCIGVANISRNYYYIKSAQIGIQINIGSEKAFKEVLRILLSFASATIDIISSSPLEKTHGILRYAYSNHPYFVSFNDATYVSEIVAPTWRETVNAFNFEKHNNEQKN